MFLMGFGRLCGDLNERPCSIGQVDKITGFRERQMYESERNVHTSLYVFMIYPIAFWQQFIAKYETEVDHTNVVILPKAHMNHE